MTRERLPVQEGQLSSSPEFSAVDSSTPRDERIAAFVINLDRSFDRWQHIRDQAQTLGLKIERVAGVDAGQFATGDSAQFASQKFIRANGRPMLPAEYGCYLAHLSALGTFLSGSADAAVIMEDDVTLQGDLLMRASAILDAAPSAEVVKLLNHRTVLHRMFARTSHGDLVGRCLFGPQGSAACYLVTREGATKLLNALQEIELPYDIALERGWHTGINVCTVKDNLLHLSERSLESQIADRARYRSIKLRGYRKIPTHIFRLTDLARRLKYAFG